MATLGVSIFDNDSHHFSDEDEIARGQTYDLDLMNNEYRGLKKPKKSTALPSAVSLSRKSLNEVPSNIGLKDHDKYDPYQSNARTP
jgi:hypothetical protein